MPKNTRKHVQKSFIKSVKQPTRRCKIVSFASKNSHGEPVRDHSREQEDLYKNLTELFL